MRFKVTVRNKWPTYPNYIITIYGHTAHKFVFFGLSQNSQHPITRNQAGHNDSLQTCQSCKRSVAVDQRQCS